jgi:hypothetical protein
MKHEESAETAAVEGEVSAEEKRVDAGLRRARL